jgi:CheY-like chemotaxis protein/signal transduction histidine kinase/HAMP domain-containing protein
MPSSEHSSAHPSQGRAGPRTQRSTSGGAPRGSHHRTPDGVDALDTGALLNALVALARGDFTARLPADKTGITGKIYDAFNQIAALDQQLAGELVRASDAVGKEGRISHRAQLANAQGSWVSAIDAVNTLIGDLVQPTSEVARVIGAVARGDLAQTMALQIDGRPLRGEFLHTAGVVNTMVEQLSSFASEVTRVAREVGTEGKLGGQARVEGVSGTWKDLTDSVNRMASNLTAQVRNIAEVTKAVARGDLSRKITVDVRGEILELKDTVNTMVGQLSSFASEVTRVAREVGTEGKLGGQAVVEGVAGTWKDLTENVNSMASNLTGQVRNIAQVTTAVAYGDLSKKITVDAKGEILELKNTINTMVDQLSSFASEVTRVAREVGTEGRLGGQAVVRGVWGTWKDLTENVNFMASNLTSQVRNIAEVTTAVANGDLSKKSQKISVDARGEILELKNTINRMIDNLNTFTSEVTRVVREVGTEGKLGGQAEVRGVSGIWKDLTDNLNQMASNLTAQVRNIAEVTTAVARGELSKKITVDVRGEILELKNTINTMVDQLSSFASEVSRVAREVGIEGRLGGQAEVVGIAGTWKDLTVNVNSMAAHVTSQVRGIARVVSAVASGDLKRKLTLDAKGELAVVVETINGMIDTLATFADEVTTVAREVGVEGKLGGQAKVPSASGTWRALTDNVNQLAANLTTQVRAIAEVATAVTKGDLTRSISLEAQGEMSSLKDNINQMIANLRETTRKNEEQDWLKTNVARFTRMMQGQRDLEAVSKMIMRELAPLVRAQQGVFFILERQGEEQILKLLATYAYRERKHLSNQFRIGEGLLGQCVLEKERILVSEVPPDYVRIGSGLGEAKPLNLVVLPVLFEGAVLAVIELASFHRFNDIHLAFLDQVTESIGIVLNTIAASMRTEELLKQSTSLADELRIQQSELSETNRRLESQARSLQASEERLKQQQEELQQTNEELEERSRLLQLQNEEVERKNAEIESARHALEEKAEQLALTSKYKSEFLANMSHELRTPLNSLLILSKLLADNPDGNLAPQQVEFAQTIHGAGSDLLSLINDILDLSKIESGTMTVDVGEVGLESLQDYVERTFREVANDRKLDFIVQLASDLPHSVQTDARRLQQILKNLLSNAFKFTEQGHVRLNIGVATGGWTPNHPVLAHARRVISFAVEDSGIGIPREKQQIIFEAFQQADGTTSRKYGGTGLGLSISREIGRLLGGEIKVQSEPGRGSTFTLYLPETYLPPAEPRMPPSLLPPGAAQDASRALSFALRKVPPALEQDGPRVDPALLEIDELQDDRRQIGPGDRVLLIIEDDMVFARLLLGLARENGFKGLVALRGDVGLALAREYKPDAISLDIGLPVIDGWTLLDRLKHDPNMRHIPVHIISASEEERQRGLRAGAIAVLRKPVTPEDLRQALQSVKSFVERPLRYCLVVEDDPAQRQSIVALIGDADVETTAVGTGAEALRAVREKRFDCVVMDLGLPDMSGAELLARLKQDAQPGLPVIIYTGKELSEHDELALKRFTDSIIIKSAKSPEHLLDETALFLHRVESNLPETKRKMLKQAQLTDPVLSGRKVLVVDDDVRNIFALTSVLERAHMQVLFAENGKKGMELIRSTPDLSVVLMDVMMPEMDGYETMRAIREEPRLRNLPVIALTAKAMKGDRERCIEAGASDYITKPVDSDQLLSLLRVWVYQRGRIISSL